MTNMKSSKKALIVSSISMLLCFAMLLGTTFAWFTDSVTSTNNIVKSGSLDVEMYWADGTKAVDTAVWTDASTGAIFNYDNWEPGYVQVRHIKIANEGSLALAYKVNIVANGEVSDLADVIDVYYVDPAVQVADRADLADVPKIGTLTEVLAALGNTGNGTLVAGAADTITIAFKMQESAGNEYQNKSIGTDFSVQLLATQLTYEGDSFDNQYDKDTTYPSISVPVTIPNEDVTAPITLKTNGMNVEMPADVINELADEITSISITFSQPVTASNAISYDFVEVVDQNGAKIDLSDNTTPIEVRVYVGNTFNAGDRVKVFHDGEEVASVTVDAEGYITYETLHFCEVVIALNTDPTTVVVSDASELLATLESVVPGTVIDATGITIDINSVGVAAPGGIMAWYIPGGVTIKGLKVVGSYRGGNYLIYEGSSDQEMVFENCTFEPSGRAMGLGLCGSEGGVNSVVYNDCIFKGPVITNFVDNPDGVATFNNCTITKHTTGNNYVMAMGGEHIFNACTFDYTGLTQSNMGTINAACVNAVSESDGSYSTAVVLDGCTRIDCGTRTYGPKSKLTVK